MPIHGRVTVCTGTNDCRRVRFRVSCRGTARGRGRNKNRVRVRVRGRSRYEAVGGLRRLLHGVASAGVAAAYNADLQALQAEYQRESKALTAKLADEQEAKAKALTMLEQLQAQLDATPDKQSADAKALHRKIAGANRALQFASDNIKGCRTDLDHNHAAFVAMLKASQGALLA